MMRVTKLFALSVLFLVVAAVSWAEDPIPAQPITLSPLVGNEQSDFFFTSSDVKDYVVFSGAVPLKGGASETRSLFSVKIREITSSTVLSYTTVGKLSPLKKLASFKVPAGTRFDMFLQSDNTVDGTYVREVFRVPGLGLYMTTDATAPKLISAEKPGAPIAGAALRFPANQPTDSQKDKQFRVVFGATDKKKGSEPFQSIGSAPTSKILGDIAPGAPGSNPSNFTTFENEVYFLASNPASGFSSIYRSSVSTANPKLPAYSAVNVANFALPSYPSRLVGSGAGLFYTIAPINPFQISLYRSDDGISFNQVKDTSNAAVTLSLDSQLTPSIDPLAGDFALSVFDGLDSVHIFGVYHSLIDQVLYPENANTTGIHTTNPTHITSTGSYYYFSALYDGTGPFLARNFTGGSTLEYISAVTNSNLVENVQEMVDVPDSQFSGVLYFTADGFVDGSAQTGILFSMTPDSADPIATPVRTIGNHLVYGAHNLRAVKSGQVFRLYFTAPVNGTTNAEYAAGGTDYGTKPWVVNTP